MSPYSMTENSMVNSKKLRDRNHPVRGIILSDWLFSW